MNGSTPFLNSRTWSPFFEASMAHQMTTASRATSEGWKLSGPMSTQRRAPLIEGAMARVNGSSGISSSTSVPRRMRPGELAPAAVVLPGGDQQQRAADRGPGELAQRELRARRSRPAP